MSDYVLRMVAYDRNKFGRIETGPTQLGDDWPGVFIRGDHALLGYAPALRAAIAQMELARANDDHKALMRVVSVNELKGLLALLESCAVQPMSHTCHWPGCPKEVPPSMWGCKPHWFKLPLHLRNAIWRTYRPGQEITKDPSAEYIAAAMAVRAWIEEQR